MTTTKALARREDGIEVDITEGVQAMYDHLRHSLDWGSGFYTIEDVLPVLAVAEALGFPDLEEVQEYVAVRQEVEEHNARVRALPDVPVAGLGRPNKALISLYYHIEIKAERTALLERFEDHYRKQA